jgi:predicted AAA+ superfamily ATPase
LPDRKGRIFEQLVGLEILKYIRSHTIHAHIYYWRDSDGPEVDWIIEYEDKLLPVEVKFSKTIGRSDLKHLKTFMSESSAAKTAIVVNQSELNYEIESNIEIVGFKNLHHY